MALKGCFSFLLPHPDRALGSGANGSAAGSPALRILTANDIYRPERLAMLKTLARTCAGPGVTKLVLPGDLLGGSLFATSHRGESVVDVLNALDVDYCTLGNHEFDYGADRTKELMDRSRFPWLGSNVREQGPGDRRIFHSTVDADVFEVPAAGAGAVKVGVFGLCTAATPELSHPGPSIAFESPVEHARRCVEALQQRGCELIVALTHLSLAQDKQVAEACPGLRAILGGHDHDPYLLVHHGTFIAKCGQNADHLGVLDLYLDRAGPGLPLTCEHSFQLLTTSKARADPGVLQAAAKYLAADDQEEICRVGDAPLSTSSQELRTRENAFGCYVADAIRWSYREEGCEVALQNGGFVRQDALYAVGTVLSASQVREEMPFPKRPILLSLSGKDLRYGLEEMLATAPVAAGSFPQLSEGFRVAYCPHAPKLGKIRHIEVGGRPLDPDREYRVAISEFYTMKAGDKIEAFTRGRPLAEHGVKIRDVAVDYFRSLGTLSGKPPGRLVAEASPEGR